MKITYLVGFSLAGVCAIGCGGSNNESPPGGDAGSDSSSTATDAAGDAHTTHAEGGTDGAAGSGPIDTGALAANTWTWIPVEGAICRDGSPTGIGINLGTASDKLMIYMEGGGACFNAITCGMNPSTYGSSNFASDFVGAHAPHDNVGILNRSDPANVVKDWNFIYVPYCTGDIHAGNNPNATVPGVKGKQQFVGYKNVELDLKRIVPSFPGLTKVLLTGVSAGGFGAASNYVQVATAFSNLTVYELDDSGPPMSDPYLPKCLQSSQSALWGFESTILAGCGADCPDHSNYPVDLTKHVLKMFPNGRFGLIESTDDMVITEFFGFGANNCTGFTPVSGATFTAGLASMQAALTGFSNTGSFIFTGTQHTSLGATGTFDNGVTNAVDTLVSPDAGATTDSGVEADASTADGSSASDASGTGDGGTGDAGTTGNAATPGDAGATIKLTDWVAQLVAGNVSNVGP